MRPQLSSGKARQFYEMAEKIVNLTSEITAMGTVLASESLRLARKVSLLTHLVEEIRDFAARSGSQATSTSYATSSPWPCLMNLELALGAVKKFLVISGRRNTGGTSDQDSERKKLEIQYQYVTWQLERVVGNVSYVDFMISDEVQEEVELVLVQLRREIEKNGPSNLNGFQEIFTMFSSSNFQEREEQVRESHSDVAAFADSELRDMAILVAEVNGRHVYDAERMNLNLLSKHERGDIHASENVKAGIRPCRSKSSNVDDQYCVIPEDFLCPISLELMRDPVIVSTGQTYERSFIQRWIDCGNHSCPKTQQKLINLSVTPNYVLRSLIMQWCDSNQVSQPYIRSIGGLSTAGSSSCEVIGDRSLINTLVSKLSSRSRDEQRSAVADLRALAKQSTDYRILLAEAGAIPALVGLLLVDDKKTQEHAVTSILNLSIYDHNKGVIMLAGAILPLVQVLRNGSMEARENASAAIYSLSLIDENRITIGGTPGVMEALVELLNCGTSRAKKDAATALFNLCFYHGNKARAVRSGIVSTLVKMLNYSPAGGMVDEALTILSVLVSHREGKQATSKANAVPLLIDLLRTGQPRSKENATAILHALCRNDSENLACLGRLGAVIPLAEISKGGTERAKRKAAGLLESLQELRIF